MSVGTGDPVNVRILERDYLIACPPEEREDLARAATLLEARLKKARESAIDLDEEKRKAERALKQKYKEQQEEIERKIEDEGKRELERLKRELDAVGLCFVCFVSFRFVLICAHTFASAVCLQHRARRLSVALRAPARRSPRAPPWPQLAQPPPDGCGRTPAARR